MGGVDNEGFEEEDKIDQKFGKKGKNTKYKNTKKLYRNLDIRYTHIP